MGRRFWRGLAALAVCLGICGTSVFALGMPASLAPRSAFAQPACGEPVDLIANGGFESPVAPEFGTPPDGWSGGNISTVDAYSGSQSIILALDRDVSGPFNIGTGTETDVNHLFALLCAAAGRKPETRYGPAKLGEQQRSALDPDRARAVLGWEPSISLADGLAKAVAYFRQRMDDGRSVADAPERT